MKYLYKLSIYLLILPFSVFSQGENDNWYFGNQAAVNFSSGYPISQNGGQTSNFEGAATVSDSSGQLLFYSDGRRIWNRNHQIMSNGSLLTSSGLDASQGVVIVPFPNRPNEYLVFTTNGGGIPPPESGPYFNFMAFSRVDMSLNNGLGDVVELNTPLQNHTGNTTWIGKVEAITIINNNDENYWVVLPYQNKLLSYYVDENGVNITPIQSTINYVNPTTTHIKISPNNEFLAISEFQLKKTTLYSFDASTGQVASSTPLGYFILQGPTGTDLGIYSAEFSSESNNIWLAIYGSSRRIYGFDLNNLNGTPTLLQSNSFSNLGTLQRGINDDIFLASDGNNYLISINNSNDLINASLDDQSVYLNGNQSRLGLPQLVPIITSSCSENLVLNSPEINNIFSYEVSNNITTISNYVVSSNQNITLSSGNSTKLLPNTLIQSGATFLAKIEGCEITLKSISSKKEYAATKTIYINIDTPQEEMIKNLSVYPNPVSNGKIYITTKENLIKEIEIFDVLGKKIYSTSIFGKELNISKLSPGIYILKIKENNISATRKLVVR